MLFNSLRFIVFFPAVVMLYFALPHRVRWMLLLAASYYFYMCWKAEYILLIVASTLVDYAAGLLMGRSKAPGARKLLLAMSLASNLGLLFAFKYFNFFSDSTRALLQQFNIFYDAPTFHLLLPVGISFYTFQTLSYSIDVYRGNKAPERHLGIFAVYVAFFPQLVAGPIERSERLLPQFLERHQLDWARVGDGLSLMLWGFFKKIVIADRLAVYVNEVFNHPGAYEGAPVWLAAYFFSFQIYCDFSGYSDIAIGSARVMGFDLMDNFRRPYFARNIADFWQRWHISLSTWFRDYVYIPLGGSRVSVPRWTINVLVVFVVSGLWHGAAWTFVIWGALHGFYYMASRWTAGLRERFNRTVGLNALPAVQGALRIFITFNLVTLAYIFFRANSLSDAMTIIGALFHSSATSQGVRVILTPADFWIAIGAVAALLLLEGLIASEPSAEGRAPFAGRPLGLRAGFAYGMLMGLLVFGWFVQSPFIYFQF